MPKLKLPEGVELHWEADGEGPTVLFVPFWSGYPGSFGALQRELAPDHRILTYDSRGTGESTRTGPQDNETSTADLIAVLEETGGADIVFATSDGANDAVRAASRRPELAAAVLYSVASPLGRSVLSLGKASDVGLAGSEAVVDALLTFFDTDYRGALRTLMASNNPQMSEDELRDRVNAQVEYSPQEVAVSRLRAWMEDEAREEALALGGRLWGVHYPTQPWFGMQLVDIHKRELPEAELRILPDGPVTCAKEHAELIREIAARVPQTEARAG
jgi:pimeloyl-ACP methyl ester carboxylesterase